MHNVSFPNLNLFFYINPIAFSIGQVNIFWYGILIAFSIVLGLFLAKIRDGKYGIKFDDVEEFVLWTIPVSIIFARIYYVAFSWDLYKDDILSVFKIWNGGIAIYGGIIGAILTAIIFSKIKKIKLLDLLDYTIPFLAIGQAIGRWGNFFNREAYGTVTNNFFRMEILQKTGEYISVHPTFLYESAGLLIIFAILMLLKRKFSGEITAVYFLFYGILRAFIENLRVDSLMIGNVKVSMILSIVLAVLSSIFIIYNIIKEKKNKSCEE